jgi:hypothetical protein
LLLFRGKHSPIGGSEQYGFCEKKHCQRIEIFREQVYTYSKSWHISIKKHDLPRSPFAGSLFDRGYSKSVWLCASGADDRVRIFTKGIFAFFRVPPSAPVIKEHA